MKTQSELKVINDYICIYYSQNYQTIRINTKFRYDKNYCTKQLLFNSKAQDYELKNISINKLKNTVDIYIGKCIKDNRKATQKDCQEFINYNTFDKNKPVPQPKKDKELLDYYKEYLQTKQREIAISSYKNYKTLENALKEYEDLKNITLTFENINSKEFCLNFRDFLLEVQGLIDVTINKRFSCLKTFLKDIQDNDIYYFKPQVLKYTVSKFESEIITLSLDELRKLENLDLKTNEKWQKVRDVFILNCFMGLRYSDLMALKNSDFLTDKNGNVFYKNYNAKTQIEVIIPILQTALRLLNKYNYQLPNIANAIFNKELKNILTFYHLFEEPVIKHYMENGEIKEQQFKRRELISSHTCRRCFITNSLINNVNLSNLMKATGHKKLSTVSRYMERRTDFEDFKKLEK